MKYFNIKWLTVSLIIYLAASCASQTRRFKLGELGGMSIGDIVHPKILERLGIDRKDLPPEERNDPELEAVYYEFRADAELYDRPVTREAEKALRVIKFVDVLTRSTEAGVVATCNRYYLKSRTLSGGTNQKLWTEIEVLKEKANAFAGENRLRFKMLIYHELFHCLYNRGHLREGYGIMAETLLKSDELDDEKWQAMVENMFRSQFDLTDIIEN